MSMTNSLAASILTAYYVTPVIYLGLHSADPTTSGNGATEIAGGSYTRQRIIFGAPSNRAVANDNQIIFLNLPATTVTWFGIWSASTGGTCRHTIQAGAGLTFSSGGTLVIPVSDIAITLA
jgi:hypothetical protein